jgi:hypothetical protein
MSTGSISLMYPVLAHAILPCLHCCGCRTDESKKVQPELPLTVTATTRQHANINHMISTDNAIEANNSPAGAASKYTMLSRTTPSPASSPVAPRSPLLFSPTLAVAAPSPASPMTPQPLPRTAQARVGDTPLNNKMALSGSSDLLEATRDEQRAAGSPATAERLRQLPTAWSTDL